MTTEPTEPTEAIMLNMQAYADLMLQDISSISNPPKSLVDSAQNSANIINNTDPKNYSPQEFSKIEDALLDETSEILKLFDKINDPSLNELKQRIIRERDALIKEKRIQ